MVVLMGHVLTKIAHAIAYDLEREHQGPRLSSERPEVEYGRIAVQEGLQVTTCPIIGDYGFYSMCGSGVREIMDYNMKIEVLIVQSFFRL